METKNTISFINGLGGRSIITISFLLIIISLILSLFFTQSQKKTMEKELIKRTTALANNFAYNSQYWVLTNDEVTLQQLISGVMKNEEIIYVFIVNQNKMIIGRTDTSALGNKVQIKLEKEIHTLSADITKKVLGNSKKEIIEIIRPIEIRQDKKSEYEEVLFDRKFPALQKDENKQIDSNHPQVKRLGIAYLGVSLDFLNKAIADVQKKAFMITFGIIIVGILFTIIMTRFISNPLRKLMDATKIVAQGDLDYSVSIKRKDEIGILAQSFNRMTGELKKSREKIENWNKELEAKVIERTKELSVKNLELKKYSEELQKAYEELQTLDKAKDDFLALVSHELRTPLSSIVAYTEVLLDDMAATKEEEQSFLEIIKSESDRLTRLINDVLDISKMEAGRMPFDFNYVELKKLVNASVGELAGVAKKHNHTILNKLEDSPIMVFADADKIIQVISNILSNAIKFTPDGGLITISGSPRDNEVEIAITDNGIGIREEDFDKVFDKFQQIEDVNHHSEGTGLGMPISKLIIENHKGKISLTSKIGKGSTFFFTLPVKID